MKPIPSLHSLNRLGFISGGFSRKSTDPGPQPDPGFVFVFTAEDEQVYVEDDPIQVPEEFANTV
jgi:hypothetical protein